MKPSDGSKSAQLGIAFILLIFQEIAPKSLSIEALAKPRGNEGRHGPVKLRGVFFLTESIVASVL